MVHRFYDEYEIEKNALKKRMQNLRKNKNQQYRMEEFSKVQGKSMVDPSILKTEAFKLVQKEFEKAFKEAPDYT